MNFLELVQTSRVISGMQGVGPASVLTTSGVEEVLVRFTREAYIDIQNLREEWDFLSKTHTFSTTIGKKEYTNTEILITDLKKYNLKSFILTDTNGKKNFLGYIERSELERLTLNETTTKIPTLFSYDEADLSLILNPIPDKIYNVAFRYWRTPETLSTDTQVPLLPISFHQLIIYKTLEKLAVYLGSPELYREYSVEAAKMQGQLMRMYIPKMNLRARPLA